MSLTQAQQQAVAARGNVLVMAGAGTGKTSTLVERCLDCLTEGASLDELLIVTFTEAAAAEMRHRLRAALEERAVGPDEHRWAEQLALFDRAHIGTLHGFCLQLVRLHFHELGLDPQLSVLDEGQTRILATETLEAVLDAHYNARTEISARVRELIQTQGGGRDDRIRALVLQLHHYTQAQPDPAGWFEKQLATLATPQPTQWRAWFVEAVDNWRAGWEPELETLAANNEKAAECLGILRTAEPGRDSMTRQGSPSGLSNPTAPLPTLSSPSEGEERVAGGRERSGSMVSKSVEELLARIVAAGEIWPPKRKTILAQPLEKFFADAAFLASLTDATGGTDPLAEDWEWTRGPLATLLNLAQEFSAQFADAKREIGGLDFHDLEQFTLRLLWDFPNQSPTEIAQQWRTKLKFVFVDEYQDINAAQDQIITALSREGPAANRFLVGDVKQSIYRFRLAEPGIFRNYAAQWQYGAGQTIPLAENFRSRAGILDFVNSVFALLMRAEIGGVAYDEAAKLKCGVPDPAAPAIEPVAPALSTSPEGGRRRKEAEDPYVAANPPPHVGGYDAAPEPRVELHLRLKSTISAPTEARDEADGLADLQDAEKEARLVALRLRELQTSRHEIWDHKEHRLRPVAWRDMAVLLRSPSSRAEGFAKEFARLGIPLVVERGGFFESTEVTDLLSLLQVLDNPLQDLPLLAVLRSPLVGLSLDELAQVRLALGRGHFWTAANRVLSLKPGDLNSELARKLTGFFDRFRCWRKLARHGSLSRCLDTALAETLYADWLRGQERGAQRHANVQKLFGLAQQFDQFQRQGLYRFVRFIEAQRDAGVEPDVPATADREAVRLMSIHQSKGLEFPVVALANLGGKFNESDLRAEIILDEQYGLCPQVKAPDTGRRYPSLPHWLAQQRQRRELRGEELRLLYVAMTRARDTLLLTASVTAKAWAARWQNGGPASTQSLLQSHSHADWLAPWFAQNVSVPAAANGGTAANLRWILHDDSELAAGRETVGENNPLPLPELDDASLAKLRQVVEWNYPFAAATQRTAKTSVTTLRREAEEEDAEAEQKYSDPPTFVRKPARRATLSAAEIGIAHHKFLQHFRFAEAADPDALRREAIRLEQDGVISPAEVSALDFAALAGFWNSDLGGKIRAAGKHVRRELPFTARFSPAELAAITGEAPAPGMEDEFVIVQGVADLVMLAPDEIWLVDFKTDDVSARELPVKIKKYSTQLRLYAQALARIFQRPVTDAWLHFLMPQENRRVEL